MIVGGVVIGADFGYGAYFITLRVFITIRQSGPGRIKQNRGRDHDIPEGPADRLEHSGQRSSWVRISSTIPT
jgi:hypothetical protein